MGIMTRLYHRSQGLSNSPYKQFFLDMGENIHIHYRDLRIELSVPEFIEFNDIFNRCAPVVLEKIKSGYQDGVLPNTNELGTLTTVALNKPLQHPVKYNPNRISIEMNVDGYHIHLRNYKLLLDEASFTNVLRSMNDVVEKKNSHASFDEILQLISHNDLEFRLIDVQRDTPTKVATIEIAPKYAGKLRQVFKALNFKYERLPTGMDAFRREGIEVKAKSSHGALPSAPVSASTPSGQYIPLVEYLTAKKKVILPNFLNVIRLQVLNAVGMVKNGADRHRNLDYRSFLFNQTDKRVVFQATDEPFGGDPDAAYTAFSKFLANLGLSFIKPEKNFYDEAESAEIWKAFHDYVEKHIIIHPCVRSIHVLGSSTKNKLGKYATPFVHSSWVKLASDIDVLIEIDEDQPVPSEWERKVYWDVAGSYYYHLGDVPCKVESVYTSKYPYAKYYNHLIEAYLFYPSNCDVKAKNKFLAGHKARLIYTKADGLIADGGVAAEFDWISGISELLVKAYGFEKPVVSPISVASHNKVYKADCASGSYAIKVYHDSNFTPAVNGSNALHIDYECELLEKLASSNVTAITAIKDLASAYIQSIGQQKAMVFPYIAGKPFDHSVQHIESSAALLAKTHLCLPPDALRSKVFDYSTYMSHWLGRARQVFNDSRLDANASDKTLLNDIFQKVSNWFGDGNWSGTLAWVHGHGDVNPRNFIYTDQTVHIFDFQAARYMPRIADIAEGLIEFSIESDQLIESMARSFMDGYQAVSRLTEEEWVALANFIMAGGLVKTLIMLENCYYYGYRISTPRLQALIKVCSCPPVLSA